MFGESSSIYSIPSYSTRAIATTQQYPRSSGIIAPRTASCPRWLTQTVRLPEPPCHIPLPFRLISQATIDALLDLLRRLPPTRVEENVNTLCDVAPDFADDILGNVDQPLKVLRDEASGKDFLGCDYNRDGDSFRYVSTGSYRHRNKIDRG
jgi:hypothetical protein